MDRSEDVETRREYQSTVGSVALRPPAPRAIYYAAGRGKLAADRPTEPLHGAGRETRRTDDNDVEMQIHSLNSPPVTASRSPLV